MNFEFSDIKDAYIKLKTYVYYDNNDLLLRRQLVEFESNSTKDVISDLTGGPEPYRNVDNVFGGNIFKTTDEKLKQITEKLNSYHNDPSFFNYFINRVDVNFYPKKIKERDVDKNFISNKIVQDEYTVERVTPFIFAPIELHIVAVLWILKFGKDFDSKLKDCCLGNRLLLDKEKEKVVQGSGLFKPYFKQYKKWRDDSVLVAENLLKQEKNVLFLTLDIKDYYHSVRIPKTDLVNQLGEILGSGASNLQNIFYNTHVKYTELVSRNYQTPFEFYSSLKKEEDVLQEIILPIGLLSSYIIGNYYLRHFDKRIVEKIKPAYYGRYVDDILIVLSDPNPNYNSEEEDKSISFNFDKYKNNLNSGVEEVVSFEEDDLSDIERYILVNFYPVLNIVNKPKLYNKYDSLTVEESRVIKICGYRFLYCQSDKSLLYYFDHNESSLVIDKLKKELDDRTSEFRDFPDDESTDSFEESAYNLQYDGAEGKIKTLRNYKENRFGLTIYLSNKIFSALRHEKKISEEEKNQVLLFFRGENCLNFYKLWEKIFTFFLVNDQALAYVEFYLHCASQIDKIKSKKGEVGASKVNDEQIISTLINYLDCSHELTLSLNPSFIKKTKQASLNFNFQLLKLKNRSYSLFYLDFEPTKDDSYWVKRFRRTNMVRHQYVVHPLLSFTNGSKKEWTDLTSIRLDFKKYILDPELIKNSPRPVKFWECCLAVAFSELGGSNLELGKINEDSYFETRVLGLRRPKGQVGTLLDDKEIKFGSEFYLDDAFNLYKFVNEIHVSSYILNDSDFRDEFYKRKTHKLKFDKWKRLKVQEFQVNVNNNRLNEPTIAFVNTEVDKVNIISSLRGKPNLTVERYNKLANILKSVRKLNADVLLFPESFVPINLLTSQVNFSAKEQVLLVTGLEHLTINKVAFNFIVTVLPIEVNGIKDAVVVFRLKNHYAHMEEELIYRNHLIVPKPKPYRYDVFNWRNLYFTTYYCFELANAIHRSLLKGKIDLLIGVEWNRDTPYFSNIVESVSRDLHTYVAQVNTSQFGDTRLTQPVDSARKDLLKLKGGINDAVLLAKINLSTIREFQRKKYSSSPEDKDFKPLPPDYLLEDVMKRINNGLVF
ncbi:RNA-directed DNA polymerase [Rufibacter latericius]|uniref:RNA-directed DNA polymerase n=1 Tax=Rufibacter latericius TaxID=2487040 RepID=A0A3M9MUK9_9BACT|nr:RNA-directed DNA polymerase [Rufibacter latericius]RNI29204.1 RNA-directed DNA polymerase [Rufibacter latericius]